MLPMIIPIYTVKHCVFLSLFLCSICNYVRHNAVMLGRSKYRQDMSDLNLVVTVQIVGLSQGGAVAVKPY